ncbi:hypothetical protein RvY_04505-2 [Ramazzottius varieornatus]|uniref:Serine protease HTRA2, mitochondrial n=1 Tax=Ramazzottius varieornatus TaxID=947166 RepID=A0A1D1V124_RAMVA|nr:hypothetical protein RvY_04505-2 [Ramazzottius varieornatus]
MCTFLCAHRTITSGGRWPKTALRWTTSWRWMAAGACLTSSAVLLVCSRRHLPYLTIAEVCALEDALPRSKTHNFIADVVEAINPGVVYIQATGRHAMLGVPVMSNGSGFLVSEHGLILTNAHVVSGRREVEVKLSDGQRLHGNVLYVDVASDLAVVKITGKNFPFLKLGSSSQLRMGEYVVAIGSPMTLDNSVTTGVVSAFRGGTELSHKLGVGSAVAHNTFRYIQTDAAITHGNSGGPLVNLDGHVVGISTMKLTEGISFAIPIDHAKEFLAKVDEAEKAKLSRKSAGEPAAGPRGLAQQQRKVLGLTMLTLTADIIAALRERSWRFPNVQGGVYVHNVFSNSPAFKAGIRPGDVVIGVDGRDITSTKDVFEAVERSSTSVQLTLVRGHQVLVMEVLPEVIQ